MIAVLEKKYGIKCYGQPDIQFVAFGQLVNQFTLRILFLFRSPVRDYFQ